MRFKSSDIASGICSDLLKGGENGMWNHTGRFVERLVARFSLLGEEGQAMVEYALIVATISIAAIAVFTPLGTAISSAFNTVLSNM